MQPQVLPMSQMCQGGDSEKIVCQLNCESKCVDVLRSMVAVMTKRAGMDARHSNRVALAVDEVFANIAEHGYGGAPGRIECETHIRTTADGERELIFELRDFATSGWVYHENLPAEVGNIDDISPGGLGLHLVVEVADCFEQQLLPDGNRWHLVFALGKITAEKSVMEKGV